jgi:hypothetical protein
MIPMRLCARSVAALFAGLFAVGCGGGHDIESKQLEELQAQVAKLRAEQGALTTRLERAELMLRAQKTAPAAALPGPSGGGRPEARSKDAAAEGLNVATLRPESTSEDPDADAPRPILRASGNSGVIQDGSTGTVLLDDRKDGEGFAKKRPWAGSTAKGGAKSAGEKKKP